MLLSFDFGTFLHKKLKVSNMFSAKSKQDVHFSLSPPDCLPTRDIFANIIIAQRRARKSFGVQGLSGEGLTKILLHQRPDTSLLSFQAPGISRFKNFKLPTSWKPEIAPISMNLPTTVVQERSGPLEIASCASERHRENICFAIQHCSSAFQVSLKPTWNRTD